MRNHNHLLGTVDGVDGIKTGYIHDSGFNIVTSVRRANRHIVAVVFGGRTADARDARVRSLIDNNINIAAVKRTAPPVVEGWETARSRKADRKTAKEKVTAATAPACRCVSQPACTRAADAPLPGSTDRSSRNSVKTFTVQPGSMQTAALSPLPSDSRKLMPAPADCTVRDNHDGRDHGASRAPPPPCRAGRPAPPRQHAQVASPVRIGQGRLPLRQVCLSGTAAEPAAKPRGGWMIQVGAFDRRERSQAAAGSGARQGQRPSRQGRPVHRTDRQRRQDAVSRPLCRARKESGGSRLQTPQAQRHSMHVAEKLRL